MRVVLENLRPEMVLAADVADAAGRLLLPTGTVLTEKHIRYCQMWGIPDAEVAGVEESADDAEPEFDPLLVAQAEATVTARFVHADKNHPAIDAIFKHCVAAELKKRV